MRQLSHQKIDLKGNSVAAEAAWAFLIFGVNFLFWLMCLNGLFAAGFAISSVALLSFFGVLFLFWIGEVFFEPLQIIAVVYSIAFLTGLYVFVQGLV